MQLGAFSSLYLAAISAVISAACGDTAREILAAAAADAGAPDVPLGPAAPGDCRTGPIHGALLDDRGYLSVLLRAFDTTGTVGEIGEGLPPAAWKFTDPTQHDYHDADADGWRFMRVETEAAHFSVILHGTDGFGVKPKSRVHVRLTIEPVGGTAMGHFKFTMHVRDQLVLYLAGQERVQDLESAEFSVALQSEVRRFTSCGTQVDYALLLGDRAGHEAVITPGEGSTLGEFNVCAYGARIPERTPGEVRCIVEGPESVMELRAVRRIALSD